MSYTLCLSEGLQPMSPPDWKLKCVANNFVKGQRKNLAVPVILLTKFKGATAYYREG